METSTRTPGATVAKMFSSNAPELRGLVIVRPLGFLFEGVSQLLELAAQILDYFGWAPKCTPQIPTNLAHKLPPPPTTLLCFGYRGPRCGGDVEAGYHTRLAIYTAASKIFLLANGAGRHSRSPETKNW